MFQPFLVEYYDVSYETRVTEYITCLDDKRIYFCSPIAYEFAKKVGKEKQLDEVPCRSLPVEWCNYKIKSSVNYYTPEIIQKNYDALLELFRKDYAMIGRGCDFLEPFTSWACKKDFVRACHVAWLTTHRDLNETQLKKLFNIVFDTYPEEFEENKLALLMNYDISSFLLEGIGT